MQPEIGISAKNLQNVIKLLSVNLANEVTLYTKTRNFHWNVSGNSFMELHVLFENQYKQLEEAIDKVAERIGKLGGKSIGTMQEFLELKTLKEYPNVYPNQKEMTKELLNNHETIIMRLREDVDLCSETYKDAVTTDFLIGLMEQHETIAWTLRRYLE